MAKPKPNPSQELLEYIGDAYDGPAAPCVSVLSWHLLAAALGPARLPEALTSGSWARLLGYVLLRVRVRVGVGVRVRVRVS